MGGVINGLFRDSYEKAKLQFGGWGCLPLKGEGQE
jgi:hypothetical protein